MKETFFENQSPAQIDIKNEIKSAIFSVPLVRRLMRHDIMKMTAEQAIAIKKILSKNQRSRLR